MGKLLTSIMLILLVVVSPVYAAYTEYETATNQSQAYIGVVNTGNQADDGTRVYFMPKNEITSGIGGALKIFGDAYHKDDVNYRDLGLYFYADHNNDKGTHGTGVFWINSKSNGKYFGKNPDIAFSFQDGRYVAARFSLINNHPLFIIGSNHSEIAKGNPNIKAEIQGSLALRNGDHIQWQSADGRRLFGIGGDKENRFKMSTIGGLAYYTNGHLRMESDHDKTDFKHALVTSNVKSVEKTKKIDATGTNRVKLVDSSKITSIQGEDGQTITILFKHDEAIVIHGDHIKLQHGEDFQGGIDSTLVLENIEGTWYELSRSINHP